MKSYPRVPEGWSIIPEGNDELGRWTTISKSLPNDGGYIWIDMQYDDKDRRYYELSISFRHNDGHLGLVTRATSQEFYRLGDAVNYANRFLNEDIEAATAITASWEDDEYPYGFETKSFDQYDADDWAYYLATEWDFDYDDYENLLHDLRNLRGQEWLDDEADALEELGCYDEFAEFVGGEPIESSTSIVASYDYGTYNELVNYYSGMDTMSTCAIWDEVYNRYNDENLANDVVAEVEGMRDEGDAWYGMDDGYDTW